MVVRRLNRKGAIVIGAIILGVVVITLTTTLSMGFLFKVQSDDAAATGEILAIADGGMRAINALHGLLAYETGGGTVRELLKSNPIAHEDIEKTVTTVLDRALLGKEYEVILEKGEDTSKIGVISSREDSSVTVEEVIAQDGGKVIVTLVVKEL